VTVEDIHVVRVKSISIVMIVILTITMTISLSDTGSAMSTSTIVMGHASNNMGCLSKFLQGILSIITHRPMRGTGRLASCDNTCSRVYLHLFSQSSI